MTTLYEGCFTFDAHGYIGRSLIGETTSSWGRIDAVAQPR